MVEALSRFEDQTLEEFCRTTRIFIVLMAMKYQYRELRAVTWGDIHSPYSGSGHQKCFYAGSLLDDFFRYLRMARHCSNPYWLITFVPYTNGIDKLRDRCLIFKNHFEERTEKFKRDYSISGAKLIDLCHRLMRRQVRMTPHEQAVTVNGTECYINLPYRVPYTWFNCLPSSQAQPNQRSEEQRSIYLRMRQLFDGRNHFVLEKIHHEKELVIRKGHETLALKYIVPSFYNSIHQNYGYLFFCGKMDGFSGGRNFFKERSPTVELFNYFNLDFFTSHDETDASDGVVNVLESSNMDLDIDTELHSPLRLAPIRFTDDCIGLVWYHGVGMYGYRQIRFR
ncbi:uncharacterized protein LOC110839440 [Zootermopsis nevadensis]|nr:uncharacterized protein LOC110839440 [Zootermopsis nevadensis]